MIFDIQLDAYCSHSINEGFMASKYIGFLFLSFFTLYKFGNVIQFKPNLRSNHHQTLVIVDLCSISWKKYFFDHFSVFFPRICIAHAR